jgi:plasmid maintenance system antidote protein VapI
VNRAVHAYHAHRRSWRDTNAPQLLNDPFPATSAVFVNNLALLSRVAGGHTKLAQAAELSPARVAELARGAVPFSQEMATHLEEALQLPPGWMGRPHNGRPDVPEDVRARLDGTKPAQEADMTKTVAAETRHKSEAVEQCRRENFALITGAKGAKKAVADLLELSSASITFLANGEKRFSDEVARALERKLGLSPGWFDRPHNYESVPAQVWKKLGDPKVSPAPRHVGPVKSMKPASPEAPKPRRQLMTRDELLRRLDAGLPVTTAQPQVQQPATQLAQSEGTEEGAPVPPAQVQATKPALDTTMASAVKPVARALAETIQRMSATGQLPEARALKMLAELVEGA